MTYEMLYSAAKTWTARHVAQDLYLMYGKAVASERDIQKVSEWQVEEGGEAILPSEAR